MWRVKMVSKSKNYFSPMLICWNDIKIHLGFEDSYLVPPPTCTNTCHIFSCAVLIFQEITHFSNFQLRRYFFVIMPFYILIFFILSNYFVRYPIEQIIINCNAILHFDLFFYYYALCSFPSQLGI